MYKGSKVTTATERESQDWKYEEKKPKKLTIGAQLKTGGVGVFILPIRAQACEPVGVTAARTTGLSGSRHVARH